MHTKNSVHLSDVIGFSRTSICPWKTYIRSVFVENRSVKWAFRIAARCFSIYRRKWDEHLHCWKEKPAEYRKRQQTDFVLHARGDVFFVCVWWRCCFDSLTLLNRFIFKICLCVFPVSFIYILYIFIEYSLLASRNMWSTRCWCQQIQRSLLVDVHSNTVNECWATNILSTIFQYSLGETLSLLLIAFKKKCDIVCVGLYTK